MEYFKRLLQLARPHVPKFLIALCCMLVVGAAQSSLAFLVKPALDDIFLSKKVDMLYVFPVVVMVIYFVKGLCSYVQTVIMSAIGLRVVTDLRNTLYAQMQKQSLSFFTKHPTGVLMSRITNDVATIQTAVSEAVTSLCKDTFTLICLIFVIFYRDWQLAIIAMFVFPLTIIPIAKFGQRMRKISTRTQVTMGSLTSLLQETIAGTRIVKAFGMEDHENRRFAKENDTLRKLILKSVSVNAASSPLMEFLGGIGIAAIILYGGFQVIQGNSTPGTFFSFMAALIMLYEPVKRLTNVNNTIQQGIAGLTRVFEIITAVPEIRNKPDAVALGRIARSIELQDVTFAYEETPILRNIDLTIRTGEVIAFVGMSGGGKTTLVNLIPRFYDVSSGAIRIDGRDIRDVTIESLRAQIGIVTQQTILFNDTIRNNIGYGSPDKSEAEIIEAAKSANAHAFIMNCPKGYDSVIGELGAKISGGERQRLSIARALLKDAPILILDEATSSLDTEAELEVQEALDNLMKGRTTLVIAHRLSTIRHANRIIVLINGRIVEEGTHETLLNLGGEYCRLYQLQFKNGPEEAERQP